MRFFTTIAVTCLFVLSLGISFGQAAGVLAELSRNKPGEGTIKIVQENAITVLLERHQWEQSRHSGVDGFRIRIFSDSGPNAKPAFEETKARFISAFEDIKVHESFVYPNYKLYVGDFRTKSEAIKVLTMIEPQFPDAFIVQSKINSQNYSSE